MSISPLCLPNDNMVIPQSGLDRTGTVFSAPLPSSAFSIVLLSTPRVRRALISFVAEVVISPPWAED
jgi:hypothetical protein